MTHRPFRASTALVATLSLLLPQAVLVPDAVAQERIRLCSDLETAPPCPQGEPPRGRPYIRAEDGSLTRAPRRGAAEEDAAEPGAEPEPETVPDEAPLADDGAADEEALRAELEAQMEAEARAAAEAEAEGQAEAQAQAEAEAEAEEDAARQARRAEREAQIAADARAEVEAEAQAQAEADAQAQAEDQATRRARRAEREAQIAADARAAAQADIQAQAEADAEAQAEEDAARRARRAEREAEAEAARQAEAERPAAAAAEGDDAPEVVEEVETVTSDDVRSSDEDFRPRAGRNRPAAEARPESDGEEAANDDDDSDLSDLEKALLIGLGAVAVGALLNNGNEVVSNSGDRVVTRAPNGDYEVYRDDDALLRQEGDRVRTQTFDDGSTRTIVERPDGTQLVTIRDAEGRVLRRARVLADGTQIVLLDDTETESAPVDVVELERIAPAPVEVSAETSTEEVLARLITQGLAYDPGRTFSLRQIREIAAVRNLVPAIDLSTITFPTGSAAIPATQVSALVDLGTLMERAIEADPTEVFLVEGHTDAVGTDASNLALSDRRAETVALALSENFAIPPENLVVQGYGEAFLKIETLTSEEANRRATIRRITPLLQRGGSVG